MNKEDLKKYKAEAVIVGTLEEEFKLTTLDGKEYCSSVVVVARPSGTKDYIPVYAAKHLLPLLLAQFHVGTRVKVLGDVHSFSALKNGRTRLLVHLDLIENTEEHDTNHVYVQGAICSAPILRETPRGRKIADLRLAVNWAHRSSYIYSITWGTTAIECAKYKVGDLLYCEGEFHSRMYDKVHEDNTSEEIMVWECSYRKVIKVPNDVQD